MRTLSRTPSAVAGHHPGHPCRCARPRPPHTAVESTARTTMGTSAHEYARGVLAYKAPESFYGKFINASEVYSFSIIMLWELTIAKRSWRIFGGAVCSRL